MNRNLHLLTFLATTLLTISNSTSAKPLDTCDGNIAHPCVVQDNKSDTSDVKHWRDVQMMIAAYSSNITGLDHLWMSGSGATSARGWQAIIDNVKKITQGKVTKIVDVDLRQESHGYLNNNSINLTAQYDWVNRDKTREQIIVDEQNWLQSLSTQQYITNVLTPAQFKSNDFIHGVDTQVQSIASEEAIVTKDGFQYFRLTVTDHMAPSNEDTDRFVDLVSHLSTDTWLHIHCRGGDGRTATFMVMYDMLRNANKVSFDDILKRQASVSPYYDLYKIEHKNPELTEYYEKRFIFLTEFYQFATERLNGYSGTWTSWIINHSKR